MGSNWRKVKLALGLNRCLYSSKHHVVDNEEDDFSLPSETPSAAALLSPPGDWAAAPQTPRAFRIGLSKSLSRSSSKKTCPVCLASMRRGDGHAIFTAECSHSFHFHCIVSNVKHGNQVCPVCRAKWKEIPLQGPNIDSVVGRSRVNPVDWPQNNAMMTVLRRLPPPRSNSTGHNRLLFQPVEPSVFNDDETLDRGAQPSEQKVLNKPPIECDAIRKVTIETYTEVSAAPRFSTIDSFMVVLHIKAPGSEFWHKHCDNGAKLPQTSHTARTPVDLVTVLDISGSMAGTKLALLKRAMGFVIQNLGPNDRLAVIAFSSSARRLFPLRRMSEIGRKQALQAVNTLIANGGTNIADGLRKATKVLEDRREKNPVASIILLSDGQDTYTVNYTGVNQSPPNYQLLLPSSIHTEESSGFKIPVHTFGFGADHDASSMHSISEISGGTFSFIEAEGVIQDAFAQCIGGLLSVVVKDLQVKIECVHPTVRFGLLKAGNYPNRMSSNQRSACIDVGDLYAEEERDFLVSINVPSETSSIETSLMRVMCNYNDPLTNEMVTVEGEKVRIKRTEAPINENVSIKVQRQQKRIQAAEAMAEARTAAENGDLANAILILENIRKVLSETESAKSHDKLCLSLDAELKEMQERMASRHVYEASGRAYILSGLSSHSWQRATTRGDSMDGSSLVQAYQTPLMVEMVTRSQATLLPSPSTQKLLQPVWSFAAQPKPR